MKKTISKLLLLSMLFSVSIGVVANAKSYSNKSISSTTKIYRMVSDPGDPEPV